MLEPEEDASSESELEFDCSQASVTSSDDESDEYEGLSLSDDTVMEQETLPNPSSNEQQSSLSLTPIPEDAVMEETLPNPSNEQLNSLSPTPPPYSPLSVRPSANCNFIDPELCKQSEETDLVYSYKLGGDNIDKDVKPRFMRQDKQTQSLHYFNVIAVRDRIDTTNLEGYTWSESSNISLSDILPSSDNYEQLKENFKVLVSRILCENMGFFKEHFLDIITHHIHHQYSQQMSQKSVIVSEII